MDRVLLCAECGDMLEQVDLNKLLTTYEVDEDEVICLSKCGIQSVF